MEFCRIAPDVKLGKAVKIFVFINLYGCTIVSAGAVVAKDIPPWTIEAGNPARVLRKIE